MDMEKLLSMDEVRKTVPKILVVGGDSFSEPLMEYALKMAQRLDFEIISLNIGEDMLTLSGTEREQEEVRFYERAKSSAADFAEQGRKMSVNVTSVIDINEKKKAIAEMEKQDSSIRYILSEPEPGRIGTAGGRVVNPVFNLVCSR
ncbi:hypothetical protein [Desulfolithobacter sp.]